MADVEPVAEQMVDARGATATPWQEARGRLEKADTYWLTTMRPDGRPHVMPLMAVWMDGALYFTSSEISRKAKNVARNPRCVLTVGSLDLPAIDLVVEGEASRVSDQSKLRRVAEVYGSKYGWDVTVRDAAFYGDGAPTAGPPPYVVFEVTPDPLALLAPPRELVLRVSAAMTCPVINLHKLL
jgi:nitroimidazol reductase NimA-like FMN-containing flavoprotein (pyridoxamine 5'-phosphate oxidase superfamily)